MAGHGEGLEVFVGLGGNVGLKVSLELIGHLTIGDDLLEDLLFGGGPGDAALLLLLLLGSGRSLIGLGLLGLGRCGRRSGERAGGEGDEVTAGSRNVGIRGGLVGLDDLLEVILGLAGGEEGVLHLLGDGAGARFLVLAVGLRVLVALLHSGGRRGRRREDGWCGRALNETETDEQLLCELACIVREVVGSSGEMIHGVRDLLVQDELDRCGHCL